MKSGTSLHLKSPKVTVDQAAAATSNPQLDVHDYVRCISREGEEFYLHHDCARVSRLLSQHLTQHHGAAPPSRKEIDVSLNDPQFSVPTPQIVTSQVGATLLAEPFQLPPNTKWEDYFSSTEIPEGQKQDAIRSLTLYPYISPTFVSPVQATIRFPYTPSVLLEIVIRYLHFHHRYEKEPENRPSFDVPPEHALDLIKVATLLQC